MRGRRLLGSSFVYLIANISSRLMTIILVPLFSIYLSPAEYGEYDIAYSALMVIVPVIFVDIWVALLRFLLEDESDENIDSVLASGWGLSFGISAVVVILFVIINSVYPVKYGFYLLALGLCIAFMSIYQNSLRGLKMNVVYAISGIVSTVVGIATNVILLTVFDMGARALFLALILSLLSGMAVCEYKARILRRIRLRKMSFDVLKQMTKYSFPLIFHTIPQWALLMLSRFILFSRLGAEETGLFVMANKIPLLLIVFNSVFYMAWQEEAIIEAKATDRSSYYSRVLKMFSGVELMLTAIMIPVSFIAYPLLVTEAYSEGLLLIPLLLIGTAIGAISNLYDTLFQAEKRTNLTMFTTLIGAAVSGVSMWILVDYIGLYSAGVSSILGFSTVLIVRMIITRRLLRIEVNKSILGATFVAIAVSCYGFYFQGHVFNIVLLVVLAVLGFFINQDVMRHLVAIGHDVFVSFTKREKMI